MTRTIVLGSKLNETFSRIPRSGFIIRDFYPQRIAFISSLAKTDNRVNPSVNEIFYIVLQIDEEKKNGFLCCGMSLNFNLIGL